MAKNDRKLTLDHLRSFVFVRIERFEKQERQVIFDFIESNNFEAFSSFLNQQFSTDGPSMVLVRNYEGKSLREGAIYRVDKESLNRLFKPPRIRDDSFIILLEIDLWKFEGEFFGNNVPESSLTFPYNLNLLYDFYSPSAPNLGDTVLNFSGKLSLTVKNVGQGSWNEICVGGRPKVIFDFGTSHHTKAILVQKIIAGIDEKYQKEKPGLIISHWDVDHFHFLKAISDSTLAAFSFIACRNYRPTQTSRVAFGRIRRICGNVFPIEADDRIHSYDETPLYELYDADGRFKIFNSGRCRNRNKDGLSVLVKTIQQSVLLTADQHYTQFDQFVLNSYLNYRHIHHLVVPHHGGNSGKFVYNLSPRVTPGRAVISVGKNNYGHPFSSTTDNLNRLTFKVSETRKTSNDISIPLN